MPNPQQAAYAIRRCITGDGTWLIKEIRAGETWQDNLAHPVAAMVYGNSVASCLPSGLSQPSGFASGRCAGTFSFSADPLEPRGIPAYVPAPMRQPRAEIAVTTGPRVIAPGMAVLPPLPRMLFRPGYISEQALVVSVRGFGLVLISGCGHPPMERILGVTERVVDVPIRAVVGGLHLPVRAAGTALMPQAVLGNPHPPWRPISERDVDRVLDEIEARGPRRSRCPGMTARRGPSAHPPPASRAGTRRCGPERNSRSVPRRRAEPAGQGLRRVPVGSVPGEVDPPRFWRPVLLGGQFIELVQEWRS